MTESFDWVDKGWAELDERIRHMAAARAGGRTLDDIGQEHGLSRERVRQLVTQAQDYLAARGNRLCPDWRARVRALADSPAVRRSDLSDALAVEDHVALDAFASAAGLAIPRTWVGLMRGWWTMHPDKLDKLLREVVQRAPFQPGDLAKAASAVGVPAEVPLDEMFAHDRSPLVPGDGGRWLRRRARGRDAAYLWLLEKGEPLPADEFVASTGIRTPHAVREALRRDDRFVQIRPMGTWALTEWSHLRAAPYANAVDALVAVVTEHGPISKEALFAKVTEIYPVTAWRLQQCLLSDRVGTTEAGLIDLVSRGAFPIEESEPSQPATMAVDGAGKVFGVRLTVNKDILRGSGIAVHSWLTWQLGLRQAPMARTFETAEGYPSLTARRGTSSAQISSLRPQVQTLGVVEGCQIVLLLRVDESTAQVRHACGQGNCPAVGGVRL